MKEIDQICMRKSIMIVILSSLDKNCQIVFKVGANKNIISNITLKLSKNIELHILCMS